MNKLTAVTIFFLFSFLIPNILHAFNYDEAASGDLHGYPQIGVLEVGDNTVTGQFHGSFIDPINFDFDGFRFIIPTDTMAIMVSLEFGTSITQEPGSSTNPQAWASYTLENWSGTTHTSHQSGVVSVVGAGTVPLFGGTITLSRGTYILYKTQVGGDAEKFVTDYTIHLNGQNDQTRTRQDGVFRARPTRSGLSEKADERLYPVRRHAEVQSFF